VVVAVVVRLTQVHKHQAVQVAVVLDSLETAQQAQQTQAVAVAARLVLLVARAVQES
jgi:hypothetical protein